MPDYIQYDQKGNIVQKFVSVDPSYVEGLPNIKQVDRATIESIDQGKKVEASEIVDKTAKELQDEKDAIKSEQDKQAANRQAVIDDLKGIGLKDETITFLMRSRA